MAEGDTILRAARRIEAALGGAQITVRAPNPRGRASGVERLDGTRLERCQARGKNLLLHCGDLTLHSHLGMSGAWHLYRRGERWRKGAGAAWVVLGGEELEAVQFGGPTLRVLSATQLRRDPRLARLGPDILAPDFELEAAVGSIRSGADRELGDALLDQRLIAGIGNIYKSEACFATRLAPATPIAALSGADLRAVLGAARELMTRAVEQGRPPATVYRRAGAPCPRCGTPIESGGQGDSNRRTYWCPSCQARS